MFFMLLKILVVILVVFTLAWFAYSGFLFLIYKMGNGKKTFRQWYKSF